MPWLSSMIIATCAMAAAWRIAASVHRREVAAERLEQLGGQIRWSEATARWLTIGFGPERARKLAGVTSVGLYATGIHDEDLRWIIDMPELKELYIHGNPSLSDAGLRHVERAGNLRHLSVDSPRITDAGVARLAKLRQLRELYMADVPVTDTGLTHLESLSDLRWLVLDSRLVTDRGAASIGKLARLEFVLLSGTAVTDAGLAELRDLAELQTLGLSGTLVTDAGLPHLARLRNLRTVLLEDTAVTEAGLASFEATRPDVNVVHRRHAN